MLPPPLILHVFLQFCSSDQGPCLWAVFAHTRSQYLECRPCMSEVISTSVLKQLLTIAFFPLLLGPPGSFSHQSSHQQARIPEAALHSQGRRGGRWWRRCHLSACQRSALPFCGKILSTRQSCKELNFARLDLPFLKKEARFLLQKKKDTDPCLGLGQNNWLYTQF